jgi:hypothetical protein
MAKGEYGVYCANCKTFIQFNTYDNYRPHFSPAPSGETWPCSSCGDVITYTADKIIYREDGRDFQAALAKKA